MKRFNLADRVRTVGHWEFDDDIHGTIADPISGVLDLAEDGEWQGHVQTTGSRKGPIDCYYVEFDEPADDGSGDGPFRAAVIEADCLELES